MGNVTQNSAYYGSVYLQSIIDVHISRLHCSNNYCIHGGCIYYSNIQHPDQMLFIEMSVFDNNIAALHGGAINGIYPSYHIQNVVFNGNRAQFGGAISITDDINASFCDAVPQVISHSNFSENEAFSIGGALYIHSRCATTLDKLRFGSNFAQNGGAIYIDVESEVTTNITNIIFNNNFATFNGSALMVNQNSDVLMDECNLNFNKCGQNGGIFVVSNNKNLYTNNCKFSENEALSGSAIYIDSNNNNSILSSLEIISSEFLKNKATDYGGTVYVSGGQCIIDSCEFSNNTAETKGGCLLLEKETFTILYDTTFTNCFADGNGGALYGSDVDIIMEGVLFKSCTASNGGAIYLSSCTVTNNTNISFNENNAGYGGGAVMTDNECNMYSCTHCNYKDNDASYGKNISSFYPDPDLIVINFNYNLSTTQISQSMPININISLYDRYNQLMTKTNYGINVTIIVNDSDVTLNGINVQTIADGSAKLLFTIEPNSQMKYENVLRNLTLTLAIIISSNNVIKNNYDVVFYNEIYVTPSWVSVLLFILMTVIAISCILIGWLLFKH
eukprot:301954_1